MIGKKGVLGLLLGVAGTAQAESTQDVQALAAKVGLSEREVRMVLGAHTAYPEYRTAWPRIERQLRAVLGDAGFESLRAGR